MAADDISDLGAWRHTSPPRSDVSVNALEASTRAVTDGTSDHSVTSATRYLAKQKREVRADARRLGQAIRERRRELGLSQTQLGTLMGGVDQKEVSRLEHGYVAVPPPERLQRAAIALNLEPADLLARAGWSPFVQTLALRRLSATDDGASLEAISLSDRRLLTLLRQLSTTDRVLLVTIAERLAGRSALEQMLREKE